MIHKRIAEFLVGIFMLAGIAAVILLALKVSGLSPYTTRNSMQIHAVFDNVGDLKVRAPITIAGVRVGEVKEINLDFKTFKAHVKMLIDRKQTNIPVDSAAQIFTAGLIGANYIEIVPGYDEKNLQDGNSISETHSAVILENLIGQLIYKTNGKEAKKPK